MTAPSGFFPPADDALDPAMAALSEAALADTSRLRYLDLSWTNAATGEAIGRLLSHCCASSHGGEITLEALRLGGCTQLCSSLRFLCFVKCFVVFRRFGPFFRLQLVRSYQVPLD